ncbi:hypothetical protein L2E82_07427 [Cichorium intybus]|uniref:Uncharacterized protein n=1 Tax=Cichorium intybus TaxID=13427 RepID=A0ACB9G655_CICIN|nr:hypothetical protein L2E82_07427 [Cichorium intybus]
MPDPLPSATTSAHLITAARNSRAGSGPSPELVYPTIFESSTNEETPFRSSLQEGGLPRLHATRTYNYKDDMEDDNQTPISQLDSHLYLLQNPMNHPEAWGGEKLSDKFLRPPRQQLSLPSRFATMTSSSTGSMQTGLEDLSSGLPPLTNLRVYDSSSSSQDSPLASLSLGLKGNLESSGLTTTPTRRFSSYAERISTNPSFSDGTSTAVGVGSPKIKKTDEILNSMTWVFFSLQLFQGTLDEALGSFQKSIHEDVRNLHIEVLRQFHMQEMQMSNAMSAILENQAELMKEIQLLRKENQELRQLL